MMETSNSVNNSTCTTPNVFLRNRVYFRTKNSTELRDPQTLQSPHAKNKVQLEVVRAKFFFGFSSKKKTSVLFWAAKFLALHFAPLLSLSAFSLESCPTVLVLCFGVSSFCFQRCESGEIEHLLSEPRKNFLPFDHVRYTLVIAVGF